MIDDWINVNESSDDTSVGLGKVIVLSITKSELKIAYVTVITSRDPLMMHRTVIVTLEIVIVTINWYSNSCSRGWETFLIFKSIGDSRKIDYHRKIKNSSIISSSSISSSSRTSNSGRSIINSNTDSNSNSVSRSCSNSNRNSNSNSSSNNNINSNSNKNIDIAILQQNWS